MKTAVAVASMFLVLSLVRPAGAEEWPVIPARISLVERLPLAFERAAASAVPIICAETVTLRRKRRTCCIALCH